MMLSLDDVASALQRHRWIFAKTMPKTPHWYTLRKEWQGPPEFEAVVQFIRDAGYNQRFRGRIYRCFNINGLKYWTMGARLPDTILINRAAVDDQAAYDPIAPFYDGYHANPQAEAENAEMIRALGPLPGKTLDIGCGTGLLLDLAEFPEGFSYVGIDPSGAMLDVLRRKHPGADARRTPLEDFWTPHRFDHIVSLFGAPSYVTYDALRRIPAMLAPGGRYFLMFYADDYYPETHRLSGLDIPTYRYPADLLPGKVSTLGNFRVLTGP